jgi:probable rRNA maturation factor
MPTLPPPRGASVRLTVEGGPWRGVSKADVVRRVRAMLDALQMNDAEASILLTTDDQIKNLNRIYRRKNRPTDVLAFSQREGELGERAGRLLGDIVVSVPTTRRQAAAAGRPMLSELTMLLAHGLLHLLGWDHQTPAEDRRMRRETERLCVAAGISEGLRGRKTEGVKAKTRRKVNGDSRARRGRVRVR